MDQTIAALPMAVQAKFPYASRFMQANGFRTHFVDEGDPESPPVLLLHGNPAWGYLWRDVIPELLSAGLRVLVPDMVGLGLSQKPHNHHAITLENQIANVVALIDRLDLRDMTVVCHDWGGPIGLGAVLTRPTKVAAVAVMSTWAWASPAAPFHQQAMPWRYLHAPLLGPYLLGRHAAMPGRGIYLSVVDRERFDVDGRLGFETVLDDPDKRAATWIWPRSIPIGLDSDKALDRFEWLENGVRQLAVPATVIWGRDDDVFPAEPFAERWHELWPHAEGTHLVAGRHFLQEDSGPEIGAILSDFVCRMVPSKDGR